MLTNVKPDYAPFLRSNEGDLPKPTQITHEWVILKRGYMLDNKLSWPVTKDGAEACLTVVNLLNRAHNEGVISQQQLVREALGIPDRD